MTEGNPRGTRLQPIRFANQRSRCALLQWESIHELLGAAPLMLELMPDTQDHERGRMHRIANEIGTDQEIADCAGLRTLRYRLSHFGERVQLLNAHDQLGSDARRRRRILFGDELPQTNEVVDCLRRVNQLH